MAVISVMSAKGAPGATSTALLVATLWPAPTIMVDADPLGGDVGLRLTRSDGRAMDPDRGLMSVIPAARRGLDPVTVAQHTQEAVGGQPVLVGLPGPEQAQAIGPLWPTLADVFSRVPHADIVADVGQFQVASALSPLVERSDLLLLVYRPTAWSALHARRRLESLHDMARATDLRVGIVGIAGEDHERDRQSAAAAIRNGLDWVVDYGAVAHDARAVTMFEGAVVYRPERTMLARSGGALAARLYADLAGVLSSSVEPSEEPSATDDAALLPGAETEVAQRGGRGGHRRRSVRRLREQKEVS